MNDVLKFGKKLFTASVVGVTIAWSMGLAALVPAVAQAATCPELEPGDLFKASGASAVYYLTADWKRAYFPHEDVFKSWNLKFADVVTVPGDCLFTYPTATPAGINYRAGSRLIKLTDAPAVFAITPENKISQIGSESVAAALYGSAWAKVVRDVSPFHWSNYTDTRAVWSEAKPHDGMLVKKSGDATVYFVKGGMLYKVDGAVASAAEVTSAATAVPDVRTVSTAVFDSLPMGSGSVTVNSLFENPVQNNGGVSSPVGTGSVSVSLGSDNPAAATILSDSTSNEHPQSLIPFLNVRFTANGSSDATVTEVKFNRLGIGNDSDIANLYLYDGDTKLAEYTSFSDKVVTFKNTSGLFTVAHGSSKTLTLKGDLARATVSVVGGKTYGFGLASAGSVVAGGSTGGSFPINGNLMETTAVSDLGHVYLTNYTTYPTTIKADEAGKELWRFTATADSQDMELRRLMLTLVGTVANTDVQNLRLEVGGVEVARGELQSDKTVTFSFTGTPVQINAGQSKIFVLRGDMKGGSGRVFKFSIQRQADISAFDLEYGVYNPVTITSASTAFGIVQATSGNGTSVESGTISVGVATDSPTGNIADNATNLTLAKFTFEAAGEAVKLDSLGVSCNGSDVSDVLKNVKVLLDGSQVGSTVTSMTCAYSTSTYSFGNTFVVPAGSANKKIVTVVADTTDTSVAADATLRVNLAAPTTPNATGQITLTSLSTSAQSARTLTVKSGTVSVTKNQGFSSRSASNPSGTVNASNVKIGSFIVTAGSGEAVDVTQVALADDATSQLGDNFQNLKVMNGATQVGTTISSLNTTAGTYTFTPSTAIRVAAGQQLVLDLYADIKSSVADSATVLNPVAQVDSVTATGVNTGADASYGSNVDLQAAYIAAAGSLSVTLDGDSPNATQIVLGSTDLTLGKFKLASTASEDISITDLIVSVQVSSAATGTLKNLKLFVDGAQVGQTSNFGTGFTTTYANVSFSGLNLTVPKNNNKIVTVKADITSYDDGGTSGGTAKVTLAANTGSGTRAITATGASSGTSVTAPSNTEGTVAADTMTSYRTKISVAFADDSPSGSAVGGDDAIVAKIRITNSANVGNYDAVIESLNLALSQTGISAAAGSSRELKIYKDSVTVANLLVNTNFGTPSRNIEDSNITTAGMTDVSIAAGASKTFIVTLDTQDAGSDDKLSVGVAAGDVSWSDGVSTGITSVPDSLPLIPRNLSY